MESILYPNFQFLEFTQELNSKTITMLSSWEQLLYLYTGKVEAPHPQS